VNDQTQDLRSIGALKEFLGLLESLGSAPEPEGLVQHLRVDQKLCHYTSLEGAIGIISGGDLWLTNSRYSNDDEELNYGHQLVDSVLDELEKEAATDVSRLWLQDLRTCFRAARGDQVYVCCFCEKDNLLSQWRGYAENGGGVSVEFDPIGFTAVTGRPGCAHGLMRLWKVFYDRDLQQKIIRACVDYFRPVEGEDDRIRFVVDALQFFMPTFKNSDFREERERRLIFTPDPTALALPKPKFRTRRGLLVPYFSLRELSDPTGQGSSFKLPITGVLIGPGLHRALNVESTRIMLAKHEYPGVPVRASTTPYRG
jgi:hypothetical protein